MNFDWYEYHQIACCLVNTPHTATVYGQEATIRVAISKFYYGAYNHSFIHVLGKGYPPYNDGQDHGGVRRWLRKIGLKNVARRLEELHNFRKDSDYQLAPGIVSMREFDLCRVNSDFIFTNLP